MATPPEPHRPQDTYIPVEKHEKDEQHRALASAIKRVSWGAIFAGAVVAVVTQIALSLMGLGLGLGAFDPATSDDTLSGLGIGAGVWILVSTIVAFYTGGYVAGRMAGLPKRPDGLIHGVVMWGVVSLFTIYLASSAVGSVVSGAFGVVGNIAQTAGSAVTAVIPDDLGDRIQNRIDASAVGDEAAALLRDAGISPEDLEARAQSEADDVRAAATASPEVAEAQLRNSIQALADQGRQIDRDNVVNVLVARTNLTEAEARQRVAQYEGQFDQLRTRASAGLDTLGTRAVATAERATDALSNAAWWAFLAMLIGVVAAAVGGAGGSPHDMPASPAIRRE
jgi:hypothetical protein